MFSWTVALLFVLPLASTGIENVFILGKSFSLLGDLLILPCFVETGLQGAHRFIWRQEADLSIASGSYLLGVLIVSRETLLGILKILYVLL